MKENFKKDKSTGNKEIKKLLNLSYLNYTNKTYSVGDDDLPELICRTKVYPDFLALSTEKGSFFKTRYTGVCFYQYDNVFDGRDGLFLAIYFNDKRRLKYFKDYYRGVRFVITPDYSELNGVHGIENKHRLFRARIVGLWFVFEIGACVIPNVTYPHINDIDYCISGLEKCTVVAMSTKGHMDKKEDIETLRRDVEIIISKLNLEAIIVFDTCGNDDLTNSVFSSAVKKGIKVIIPDNTLKSRNKARVRGGGLNAS